MITWLQSAILLIGFILLFTERRSLYDAQAIFALIALVGVAINFYDFFEPTFSAVRGRAAGFYENPNTASKFIAFSMVAALPVIPRNLRLWFVILCGLGILVTFSRNSWLIWGIGVVLLGWIGELGAVRYRMISALLVGIFGVGMLALLFTGGLGQLVANSPLAEYLDSNTMARLGIGGDAQFKDHATDERAMVALAALEAGAQHPLLGNGMAYTREAGGWEHEFSTHNMYLLFWVEGGFPGLALYICLLFILWRHSTGVGRVLTVLIMILSLFDHNQLDRPASMIYLAFAIAHGQLARRKRPMETGPRQMALTS